MRHFGASWPGWGRASRCVRRRHGAAAPCRAAQPQQPRAAGVGCGLRRHARRRPQGRVVHLLHERFKLWVDCNEALLLAALLGNRWVIIDGGAGQTLGRKFEAFALLIHALLVEYPAPRIDDERDVVAAVLPTDSFAVPIPCHVIDSCIALSSTAWM